MYSSLRRVRRLGYMTVSEMLETMHKNDLFDKFPEFSKVVHILAVIPATSCSTERSFSALRQLKTYHHTLINIEKAYACIRSPSLGGCNSHTKLMSRHFYRPVYF